MILNLDKYFDPYAVKSDHNQAAHRIKFESFTFPGGEPHLKILDDLEEVNEVLITHRIHSFNDFGLLLLAIDALRRGGVERIRVFTPYFPAARQDRVMIKGEPLTVKVYASILNQLNLNRITIFDPHSEVTPALLNNCEVINNHEFIKQVKNHLPTNFKLIAPDGGALKKIYKVAEYIQNESVIICSKTRDVQTGKLSGFQVYVDDLQGADCLIVDDICDAGGTFIGLAKELKKKNAGNLHLAVSHGIFSKGLDKLTSVFDTIFTTDAFQNIEDVNGVVQLKLQNGLLLK